MKNTLTTFLILLLTRTTLVSASSDTGTLYTPDPCSDACLGYFDTYYLDCSVLAEGDNATDGNYTTSPECKASNMPYLSSIAWCWELKCLPISTVSNKEFLSAWAERIPGANETSFIDALNLGEPTQVADPTSDNVLLSQPLLVDDDLFYNTYKTNSDFLNSQLTAARMGLTLIMITWALVFAGVFYNCVTKFRLDEKFLPKSVQIFFRKNILYPALFKEKCSVPISLGEGLPIDYVPPRIVSLTIAAYWIINIIFCAVPYHAFWESQSAPHDTLAQIVVYVANRAGILAFANVPILVLFASRNNIYQWMTGWTYATFQHYHRHVAIICCLEAILHGVLYTVDYLRAPNGAAAYADEASQSYFIWGIVSAVILGIMPVLAILKLRMMSYEVFMFFHYLLAIVFIVGCLSHVQDSYGNQYHFYDWMFVAIVIWAFDIAMRVVKILYLRLQGCAPNCTVEVVDQESKTMKLTYQYPKAKQSTIGNYYYLYFTTVFPFFTSHPFTAAEWYDPNAEPVFSTDSELESKFEVAVEKSSSCDPTLSFYVQCQNGITKKIYRKLEENKFQPIEIFSMLEGPYGTRESGTFDDFDFVILLTGGIGNTVVLNYLNSFVQYKTEKCIGVGDIKLSILHTDRFNGRLNFLKFKIDSIVPPNLKADVEVDLHSTVNSGRLDIASYLKNKISEIESRYSRGTRRIGVVSCGPAKFSDSCRRACVELQEKIHNETYVSYITDAFEW